jgi:DNA-binding transcriptional MerR regulator
MLTSKQLMERTGISRATLNNYVALGILPSPIVKPPEDGEGRATRLGYFPDEAFDRVNKVQELKKEGVSIADIASQFAPKNRTAHPLDDGQQQTTSDSPPGRRASQGREPSTRLSMELTLDNFPGPAYMVDNNFELMWWNEEAATNVFGGRSDAGSDLQTRNLLGLLVESFDGNNHDALIETLRPHLAAAKKRMNKTSLSKIYSPLGGEMLSLIESLKW